MHTPQDLEKELEQSQISYRVYFVEDCADLVQKFEIHHSPNLVVDDQVVFGKQPTEEEPRGYFDTRM